VVYKNDIAGFDDMDLIHSKYGKFVGANKRDSKETCNIFKSKGFWKFHIRAPAKL